VAFGLVLAAQREAHPDLEHIIHQREQIGIGRAGLIEPWYRGDAIWLAYVATFGYAGAEGPNGQHGAAFLPLMPAVMASASLVGLNPFWVGLISANLAAALGLAVFTRLTARLTNNRATAIRAFVLLNAFPSALFLSAPYQEAFGLLFIALALSAWYSGRAGVAGVSAGLGCLARMTGAVVGAAALASWLLDGPRTRRLLFRALVVAAGCAVGVVIGLAVIGWATGDPWIGIKSQAGWGRRSASIWNFGAAIHSIYDPVAPRRLEGGLAILFTVLGIRAWIKRGAFWGLVTLLPIAQMAATGTFLSGHRVLLACLPGFIELADLLKNRLAFMIAIALSVVVQLFLLNSYIHWGFAG
jgi:Gpi18-like mannosyltransferase